MQSKITQKGNFERLIEVDVPVAELTPHFDAVYRKYQKSLRLQGFRKGKVPISLIKKLYGETIQGEAIEEVVQSVFREVSEREQLKLVAPARVDDVDYQPATGLHFKAVVEVVPEIELKTYRGLALEREVYQIDDQDVSDALSDVREQMAVMEPVEEAADEGHYVLADIQQIDVTGIPIIGKKFEDRFFELNTQNSNKKLAEQLLGVKAGEIRRVELPGMAGDSLSVPHQENNGTEYFNIDVKEVKLKKLPELDDELAKDTGEFKTLDELKSDIRGKLTKQAQANARSQLRRQIIDEVLKKNAFDLPESMINNYLDAFVEGAKKESREEINEEELRNHYRPSAIWNLKWQLVKEKIQELEDFTVSENDKNMFIATLAQQRGVDEKQLRKTFNNKRAQKRLEEDVLEEKILDFLEENANIKERQIKRKDIEKAQRLAIK